MAVRQTIQIGHPSLKAANEEIKNFDDSNLKQLIVDLKDSMYDAGLIGIAAPQIAENYQVFITEPRETETRSKDESDEFRVFINPKIVDQSEDEVVIYEGCGSVLNGKLFGPVKRSASITIEAFSENGRKFQFTSDGILGRVIQHEYDHMEGIEFLEKIQDYKKMMTVEYYVELVKSNPEHIEASTITIKDAKFI